MKISAVITTQNPKVIKKRERGAVPIFSFACILSGIFFGVLFFFFCGENLKNDLLNLLVGFSTDYSDKTSLEILSGILIINFPLFLLIYFAGTSPRGFPVVLLSVFLKAFSLGLLVSYIYSEYALKGIEYCLLVLFPGKILMLFALMLFCENSLKMSVKIFKNLKENNGTKVDLTKYDLRTVIIYSISVLSALVELTTIKLFSSLFAFHT